MKSPSEIGRERTIHAKPGMLVRIKTADLEPGRTPKGQHVKVSIFRLNERDEYEDIHARVKSTSWFVDGRTGVSRATVELTDGRVLDGVPATIDALALLGNADDHAKAKIARLERENAELREKLHDEPSRIARMVADSAIASRRRANTLSPELVERAKVSEPITGRPTDVSEGMATRILLDGLIQDSVSAGVAKLKTTRAILRKYANLFVDSAYPTPGYAYKGIPVVEGEFAAPGTICAFDGNGLLLGCISNIKE